MSARRTFLERAYERERQSLAGPDTADDAPTVVPTGGLAASKNTIGGEQVELEEPQTGITFEDDHQFLSGDNGRPRPVDFFHAKTIGQTPAMEVIKNTVTQQLTGGNLRALADEGDELADDMRTLADVIEDIYAGPHFQRKTWDDLVTDAVKDMIDGAWAYHEILPSADGEFSVAGFKPLPFLQVNHNVDEDTGQLPGPDDDEPAFYWAPIKRSPGTATVTSDPKGLNLEDVVVMRAPDTSQSDRLYGQSIATKVREWLELLVDVDVHQKRYYADSHLPAGFLHFQGAIGSDELQKIEQDIAEVAGDPQELVTTSSEKGAAWIPVGGEVADLEAIQQQQWYWKLVLAAAGLNQSEINVVESSGFAKEMPALQRMIFKNVTKPYANAILDPHNADVLPRILDDVGAPDAPLRLSLERFDPVQEQIEREEMLAEYQRGVVSLNEVRGQLGRDPAEFTLEIDDDEHNIADLPADVLETILRPGFARIKELELGLINGQPIDGDGDEDAAASLFPQPELGEDDTLTLWEIAERFDVADPWEVKHRLERNTKQLDEVIEVESSFLVSTAYDREAPFMQLEFEREGEANWVYWYSGVEEFRFFNFLKAPSKGRYFNTYIRGEYPYARVQ